MIFEHETSLTLGGAENFLPQHQVVADSTKEVCRLTTTLEWTALGGFFQYETVDASIPTENEQSKPSLSNVDFEKVQSAPLLASPDLTTALPSSFGKMQAIIARGSPYSSMMYYNTTPRIYVQQQSLIVAPVIDGLSNKSTTLICGEGLGVFTTTPVSVDRYLQVQLHPSDMTWLIFFSEPVEVICSNFYDSGVPSTKSAFELKTVKPIQKGMVRVVLVNNCTLGTNVRCKLPKS